VEKKTALVVGMAKSGVSSAKLLYRVGYHVIINDQKAQIPGLEEQLAGIEYTDALGQDPQALYDGVDLMVISPVIPMHRPFVKEAQARGIEVIGEIELGWRYSKGDFVCITGTNGKTTSTTLTGEMFREGGFHTFVLGNIGIPITEHALEIVPGDVVVAETAALQLEGNSRFHARAAAVCNITEDHIDHFLTMENYIAAKARIFERQTAEDFAVLNYDDPIVRDFASLTQARVLYFSRLHEVEEGVFLRGDSVIWRFDGREEEILKADQIRIPGAHNLENAMMCAALSLPMGVSMEAVRKAMMEFPGVEHRIEFVCERSGVTYINDSKGTNPDSTIKAVQSMKQPTVLLLGGYDKKNDFGPLFEAFNENIKAVVALGVTAPQILEAARNNGFANIHHCEGTFQQAVDMAAALAEPGDAVLLSPACASWDMFDNFEQRGRVFKEIVRAYK